MSTKRPVVTTPTPLVDQLVASGVLLTDIYAYGPRKLYSGAPYAYKVRRSNDNALADIGFDARGNLDIPSLALHVGSATGTAQILYEQAGNAANMTTASTARELQLFDASILKTVGTQSRPSLYVPGTDYGYVTTMPTSMANAINSAFMIVSMSNQVTSVVPRFLSLLTGTTTGDTAGATTGLLICRNSSSTPTNIWAINRAGSIKGQVTGTFDQLDQVATIHDGTNATMWLNNATSNGSGSTGSFSSTRLTIGLGGSLFTMLPGSYISELIFLRTAANSTIRGIIHADQSAYYGTA